MLTISIRISLTTENTVLFPDMSPTQNNVLSSFSICLAHPEINRTVLKTFFKSYSDNVIVDIMGVLSKFLSDQDKYNTNIVNWIEDILLLSSEASSRSCSQSQTGQTPEIEDFLPVSK